MALKLHEKLTRLPWNNYWSQYKCHDRNQNPKMASCKQLDHNDKCILHKQKWETPVNASPFRLYPSRLQNILPSKGKEKRYKDTHQIVKQSAALETIHTLQSELDWLHIYTDGSLSDKNWNAGVGIKWKLFKLFTIWTTQHALWWRAKNNEYFVQSEYYFS